MRAQLLFADEQGRVYEHPTLLALVRDGEDPAGAGLPAEEPSPLPAHASLSALPGRKPLGFDPATGSVVALAEMKLGRRMARVSAVAAVLPPGWTRTALPAFRRGAVAPLLPQWAYTAAAWDPRRGHAVWALRTDRRTHWDPADHSTPELPGLVRERLSRDPDNPLLHQLSRCALEYRCFTAQNTFYARDEGAIPASVGCNARCIGCISEQPPEGPPSSHERMDDAPDGQRMAAIGIALEAGATALAQELLDRIAHIVVGDQGQMGAFIQWVDQLVQAGGQPSLEAHAWFVWALCDSLQYERARLALDDFDRRAAADPTFTGAGALPARLKFLRMLVNVFIDRLDAAYDQATAWLAREEEGDALTVAAVTSIAGIAEIDRGDLLAARARMQQARSAIDRSDSAYGKAWVCILRACVEIGQARPGAADTLLREGREQVARVIGNDASVVVTLDFVHARALLDLGRTSEARELALRGLERAAHHGIVASLEHGLIASVAFWGEPGDDAVQETVLERVANCYPPRGPRLLAASKVRQLLALARHEEAHAEAVRVGLGASRRTNGNAPMRDIGDWLLARLEIQVAQGASAAVLRGVDVLLKTARAQGRERDRIEILLIAADSEQRLGRTRLALRHFSLAVVLAAPGELMQPFHFRHGLLSRLLPVADVKGLGLIQPLERAFFERLRSQQSTTAARQPIPDNDAGATGLLTLRQVQLLSLLDKGLSNEQIADRLALSVPTVKWHLHNAYVNLGVRSRSAALARARALKLLGR